MSALTGPGASPEPSGLQSDPSHRAMLSAATPSMVVNDPPATSDPACTAREAMWGHALPEIPDPRLVHCEPFQRARYGVGTPPDALNVPPAMSAPLYTASARTSPFRPLPSGNHENPFHAATWLAGMPPAWVKLPPAI